MMNELQVPMHDYQIQAEEFMLSHPFCGLFLAMGTGKTLTTLKMLYDLNPKCHVLVIAPLAIARSTWLDEIAKWKFPFRTKSFVLNEKGKKLTKAKRLKLYEEIPNEQPTIYFINREMLPDLVDNTKDWYFSFVIIDEFQSFRTHDSNRFLKLASVRPKIKRLIGLTGTPTPGGLMNLWSEIYLMDCGYRLGENITTYRSWFFDPGLIVNNRVVDWIPKDGANEEIYRRISDLVISLKSNLKLPEIIFNDIPIFMSNEEYAIYKEFMKELVVEIEDEEILAANSAVLQNKLSQMASGTIYTDDKHNYAIVHTKKIEMLQYIIENTDDNVLVGYHFKSECDLLLKKFPQAVKFDGSKEMTDEWNNKKIPLMILQPQAAGHGINIQNGGHTFVWFTLPWSWEEYAQAIARLHRQGQTESVIVHSLLTEKTVDARIKQKLYKKGQTEQELIESVQIGQMEDEQSLLNSIRNEIIKDAIYNTLNEE